MQQFMEYIGANWVTWLFGAGWLFLGSLYRRLLKRQAEEARQNQAIRDGVQALLRQEIIDFCLRYEETGAAPVWAKQAEEKAYKAYEALGGNDVAHAMHIRFVHLPPVDGNKEPERSFER